MKYSGISTNFDAKIQLFLIGKFCHIDFLDQKLDFWHSVVLKSNYFLLLNSSSKVSTREKCHPPGSESNLLSNKIFGSKHLVKRDECDGIPKGSAIYPHR